MTQTEHKALETRLWSLTADLIDEVLAGKLTIEQAEQEMLTLWISIDGAIIH